ncbi:ArsR/SmtB family transcription factor [Clostridium magnum]|uniref:Transcriptional repressor SdpR n=1 Tax=Clostridium magnum DSM 2767 TaxID=1121326 RepID=A0A162SVX5_9CLOT|nr:metalloregulator ArsR/SmtB family transcription factor [Clostridium magnum]KZL91931.1 transcriptional repressor SdpR [Clostridium magnum DSM 2767]SHH29388.1 transcriptional regulator, ArsR family [Clostridium magnum DSM 2767]
MELIQVMKALADDTRMRITNLVSKGDLCVCELEVLLEINQSNASRHLNKLSNAKILEYYKKAQYVYYKINRETLEEHSFLRELLNNEFERIPQCILDLNRLKRYRESGLSCDELKDGKLSFNND